MEGIEKSSASLYSSSFVCFHKLVSVVSLFLLYLRLLNTMGKNKQDQRF